MVGAGFPDEDTSIDESLPHVSSIVEATKETEVGITVGDREAQRLQVATHSIPFVAKELQIRLQFFDESMQCTRPTE